MGLGHKTQKQSKKLRAGVDVCLSWLGVKKVSQGGVVGVIPGEDSLGEPGI